MKDRHIGRQETQIDYSRFDVSTFEYPVEEWLEKVDDFLSSGSAVTAKIDQVGVLGMKQH